MSIEQNKRIHDIYFWVGWSVLYPFRLLGCMAHLLLILVICIIDCAVPSWFHTLVITPPNFVKPHDDIKKNGNGSNGKKNGNGYSI